MTDRDKLIEQGMLTLRDAMREGRLSGFSNAEVTVLVKAGWRPPPTGDVIATVEGVLHYQYGDDVDIAEGAQALAEAGLLATPDMLAWKQRFGDIQEEYRKTLESWDRQRERLTQERDELRAKLTEGPQ